MRVQTGQYSIFSFQTSDLASANAPEDLKLKAMMIQSTKDYDPNK
jgi:hypothetical protein